MMSFLYVGVGGFAGTVLRYALSRICLKSDFPLITMLINIMGALVIGFVSELARDKALISENRRLLLTTGLCGGFTTFSTFSLETVRLLQNGKYVLGFLYVLLSVVLCLGGVCLGMAAGRLIRLRLAA